MWLIAPETDGVAPWPKVGEPIAIHDAYCAIEANRTLDGECLDPRDCDDAPGRESVVVSCTGTATGRFARLEQIAVDDYYRKPRGEEEDIWRTRLGQCFRPTATPAPAAELAALEATLRKLEVDDLRGGESGVSELVRPADAAYHRVFVTVAREITQRRGGLVPKAVIWAQSWLLVSRLGLAASPPYPKFTVGTEFGFPQHDTTRDTVEAASRYCSALSRGDDATYGGSDPVIIEAARRNSALVALGRGDLDASATVTASPLSSAGDRKELDAKGRALHDPCAK